MTMEEMQRLLERQQSRTDIMNLMGRYQYYHTGGQMSRIGRELFAWWLPDARCEYGPLGVFGAKKSLEFFDAMTELFTGGTGACHPGLLEIHQITTPVLEVAEDNQTAKGMWMSTGAILMLHDEGAEEGRSFTWDSGKYAVDFIQEDGQWKFWHMRLYPLFRAEYGKSWVDTKQPEDPEEFRAGKAEPGPKPWVYAPDKLYPANEPPIPQPYATFDDVGITFAY